MADKVKGIVLDFGVDTAKFNSGIQSMITQLKGIQKALSEVDKQLKFDPTNTVLLKQRLSILKNEVVELAKQEKVLSEKVKEANEEIEKGNIPTSQLENYRNNLWSLTVQLEKTKLQHSYYIEEMAKTERAIDNDSYATQSFSKNVEEASKQTDSWTIALGNLTSKAILEGIKLLYSGLKSVISTGWEYNKEMESSTASITAILNGNVEAADKLVESMKEIGSNTAFDTSALLDASQQLIASDISAEDATKSITNLAKALAYAGKGDNELKRMAQNLNQIQNAGKATAQDLKQFAYAGIPIYNLLAEYSEDFKTITSDTVVQYDDIAAALAKAGEEGGKFYEAFTIQAGTLEGQTNKLKSNFKELAGALMESTTTSVTDTFFPQLNELLTNVKESIQSGEFSSLNEDISSIVKTVSDFISSQEFKDFCVAVADLFTNVVGVVDETFKFLDKYEVVTTALSVISGILEAISNFLLGIKTLIAEINRVGFTGESNFNFGLTPSYSYGYRSGGFGELQSGGFMSGGITLNNTFSITNGNNIDEVAVKKWARVMCDQINEELGARI